MRNVEVARGLRRVPVGGEEGRKDTLARLCRVLLDELPPRGSAV